MRHVILQKSISFSSTELMAMAVPSVLVPEEYNLIINPLHASFKEVKKPLLN